MTRRRQPADSSILLNRVIARQQSRDAGRRCQYCRIDVTPTTQAERFHATVDHIVPQSHGGRDFLENLKLACGTCNKDRAITEHCIGAMACAVAVVGRDPARVSEWWRSTVSGSRQREIDRYSGMLRATKALRTDSEAAP